MLPSTVTEPDRPSGWGRRNEKMGFSEPAFSASIPRGEGTTDCAKPAAVSQTVQDNTASACRNRAFPSARSCDEFVPKPDVTLPAGFNATTQSEFPTGLLPLPQNRFG